MRLAQHERRHADPLLRDRQRILWCRGLRAFGDGYVSILLPVYLFELGLDAFAVGAVSTTTLLGSALLTLVLRQVAHRVPRRGALLAASVLIAATGLGFASVHGLWPLLVIAFVGTLNPSSGDVSLFLPLEHTVLAHVAPGTDRTAVFAHYAFVGSIVGAAGTLAAGTADWLGPAPGRLHVTSLRPMTRCRCTPRRSRPPGPRGPGTRPPRARVTTMGMGTATTTITRTATSTARSTGSQRPKEPCS